MAVDKQLYLPSQGPFAPAANATLASHYDPAPLQGRDYVMGELVAHLPDGTFCVVQVFSPVQTWNNAPSQHRHEDDFDVNVNPLFFYEPRPYEPAHSLVAGQRVVPFVYFDYERKHPDLRQAYEVTLIMEYVPKINEVEALTDANLRKRIYEDLADCPFPVIEGFEIAKYTDPSYSVGREMQKKLDNPIKSNLPFYERDKV